MSKFNTSNAANSIVNVIQTSIGNAAFDTTIRAIIQEKVDEATGKFKLQYQDGVFYAFADDVKINYSKGTEVFVLVPKNDFTQDKRIIGSVKTLGEDYVGVISFDERYKKIGASAFEGSTGWFSYCSNNANQNVTEENSKVLYDKSGASQLTFNEDILAYLKNENTIGIWFEATFKTYLNQMQTFAKANYGLKLYLTFDNGLQQSITLDVNSMEGNPFNLSGNRQVVVCTSEGVDWATVQSIDKLEFFCEGFDNSDELDLFVKDIKLYAVALVPDEVINAPHLDIYAPNGYIIKDGSSIDLIANLKINQKIETNGVKYFWFRQNVTIDKNSGEYHSFGGNGWEFLNGYAAEAALNTDKNKITITATSDVFPKIQVNSNMPQQLYKCIAAKSNTERYEATIEIINTNATPSCVITADPTDATIWIDKDGKSNEVTLTISDDKLEGIWYKKGLLDTEFLKVSDASSNTLTIEEQNIVNQAEYCAVVGNNQTNTITVYEKPKEDIEIPPQYQLFIKNGDQSFKYNESGYSPLHPTINFPQTIKELSFVLYDDQGAPIPANDVTSKWIIPKDNSLLVKTNSWRDKEEGETVAKDYWYITSNSTLFDIADKWDYSKADNQITLEVTYENRTYKATTNFLFLKEGDPGTNGTDTYIVVNSIDEKEGEENDTCTITVYSPSGSEKIENQLITWLDSDKTVGKVIYKNIIGYWVAKAEVKEGYSLPKYSPYVVYDNNGQNPSFSPIKVIGDDIKYKRVSGRVSSTNKEYSKVIPETYEHLLAEADGVIKITVTNSDIEVATFSLLAIMNLYTFSMINNWDGKLKIDDYKGNYMLAATVVAGVKEPIGSGYPGNTFTGVMIGKVSDNNGNNQTGFFAFHRGAQTAFIDAKDGSTILGPSTAPLIQIGKKVGEEFIQSSNYSTNELTQYKLIDEDGTTLYVDEDKVTVNKDDDTGKIISIAYKDKAYSEGFFKEIYSREQGMRIDLDDGNIYAPGYSIINGDATFEGTVKANSGEFESVTIQSNCVLQGNGTTKEVGSMLDDLKRKIESISFTSGNELLVSGKTFSTTDMGTIIGKIDDNHISYDGKKLKIVADEITAGLVGVKYQTTTTTTIVGYLGAGEGNNGEQNTKGVMIKGGNESSNAAYVLATQSGARLSSPDGMTGIWAANGIICIDNGSGNWKYRKNPVWSTSEQKYIWDTYTIEIEE